MVAVADTVKTQGGLCMPVVHCVSA